MRAWSVLRHLLREKRTTLAIALLALLAAYTGWQRMASPPAGTDGPPQAATLDTDYTLQDFTLTLLDEEGQLNASVTGRSMAHDPQAERSRIEAPRTMVSSPRGIRWEGDARQGWVSDDGGELHLSGRVRLNRHPEESVPPLQFATEVLTLYPKRDTAMTPAFVTIVQPGARLEGTGMQVDLARGNYQLHAQVRGRYDTPDSD
jgi:LPS export ABC transporter protein LptC